MPPEPPGIDRKDAAVPAHLEKWLNLFRGPWYDAATRDDAPGAPTVPTVMQAEDDGQRSGSEDDMQQADSDERLPLEEVLATSATGIDYQLRRYLTTDYTLGDLVEIDTAGFKRSVGEDTWYFDPGILDSSPTETRLEHLLAGDTAAVANTVDSTMSKFRIVEMRYSGGSFNPVTDEHKRAGLGARRSKFRNKQYRELNTALDRLTGGFRGYGGDEKEALDARVATLVYQPLHDRDATALPLELVDEDIGEHMRALVDEDYDTIRKMGNRLVYDDDGTVSNRFKKPYLTEVGSRPLDPPTLEEDQPLFTEKASLNNIGNDRYRLREGDVGDGNYFCNFRPKPTLHVDPTMMSLDNIVDEYHRQTGRMLPIEIQSAFESDHIPNQVPVWGIYEMKERISRFEKLEVLHELGADDAYDGNPAVLSSVLRHLLRFGTMRGGVSAAARELLLRGELSEYVGVNFREYDPDPKESFLKTLYSLVTDSGAHRKQWGIKEGTSTRAWTWFNDYPLAVGSVLEQIDDPRHVQFQTSLRYLAGLDPEDLERLMRQTLDLASHRIDAWWTSLATRRLAEHRNEQGNWYVRSRADYENWYGSEPYFPPAEDTPDLPEEYGEDVARRRREEQPPDPQTSPAKETQRLDAVIAELEDYKPDPFSQQKLDAFKTAHRKWVEPTNVPARRRRKELEYLVRPSIPDPDGSGKVDFFTRARNYVDAQHFQAVELDELGKYGISDYLDELEFYINNGPPGVSHPYKKTPTDRMDFFFNIQTYRSDVVDFVTHLLEVFKFARKAAQAEAGAGQQDEDGGQDGNGNGEQGENGGQGQADRQSPVDPETLPAESDSGIYVGAWGYVENLDNDPGGRDPGEYVHAPSMQQATTAAILRGGQEAFRAEGEGHMAAIDLTADRVRVARQLIQGVREDQPLGALLGYRFERALHALGKQEYIHEFRQAFPAFTGNLGGTSGSTNAARSDVVDGYKLYRSVAFEDGDPVPDSTYTDAGLPVPDEHPDIGRALEHLLDVVDALKDLLTAESVHQFAQGNYSRAKASLEAMAAGDAIPEPEVIETPRTETGLTHRLLVTFGDASPNTPQQAGTRRQWRPDERLVHPEVPAVDEPSGTVPAVPERTRSHGPDGYPLSVRGDAEPNLDSWVAGLLPDPGSVGCKAAYRWTEDRAFATGSFTTPSEDGRISVTDVGFEPDVVLLTASTVIEGDGTGDGASASGGGDGQDGNSDGSESVAYGWTHGTYQRQPRGDPVQHSTSLGYNTSAGETVGTADSGRVLNVVVQSSEGTDLPDRILGSIAETTGEGFEVDVTNETSTSRTVEVEYVAYKSGDRSTVEVGTFLTPTATGMDRQTLGLDPDHVVLTATDLLGATSSLDDGREITRTGTGATGFSHGEATAVDGSPPDEHAVSLTHDPSGSSDPTVNTHGNAAVYLPGEVEVSVTSLDGNLELDYSTVPDSTPRVVTYFAVATEEGESPPKLGVLKDGRNDLSPSGEEFTPACIEFVAVPAPSGGLTGGASAETLASAGWSHGVATGPGRQQVLADAVYPGTAVEGEASNGVAVSVTVPDGGDGTTITATVESVDETGFTVSYSGGAPEDLVVLYRAWPAEPVEREHAVPASLTLRDLDLSPLDALYFSKDDDVEGRTALEQRMAYYLLRDRDAAVPSNATPHAPIPDDATVDLRLREAGTAPMSVAELLELLRSIRETVQEGRPADADDFAHPAERAGTGYDEGTYDALSRRAERAHAALDDVASQIANRVALLDTDVDPAEGSQDGTVAEVPNVCEQVEAVHDALEAFRRAVPLSGVREAVAGIDEATTEDAAVLERELAALLDRLPAGPSDPSAVDADVTVERLTGQRIRGTADVGDAQLTVKVFGNTAADTFGDGAGGRTFEKTDPAESDTDGSFETTFDFHEAPLGASFVVVAIADGSVVYSASGRVVDPTAGKAVEPGDSDVRFRGDTDLPADAKVTIEVTSRVHDTPGMDTLSKTEETEVEADGSFVATMDLGQGQPRTAFDVVGTGPDGSEVYRTRGYVRDPWAEAGLDAALADTAVLPGLLWLSDEIPDLDPTVADSAAGRFESALASTNPDWNAITGETSLVKSWHEQLKDQSPTHVEPRIDAGDAGEMETLESLETLDLQPVADDAWSVLGPVESTVAPVVDVTGGQDRVNDATFWLSSDRDRVRASRTALANLIENPAGRDQLDVDALQFAPGFAAFAGMEEYSFGSPGPFPAHVERRLGAYLERFFAAVGWIVGELAGELSRPDQFVERFRKLVYRPEAFVADGDRSAFENDLLAVVGYFGAGTSFQELTKATTVAENLVQSAPQGRRTPQALVDIESTLADMTRHVTRAQLQADVQQVKKDLESLPRSGGVPWLSSADLQTLTSALETLARRVQAEEPLTRIEQLNDAVFADMPDGQYHDLAGSAAATAVPATEFVAFLGDLAAPARLDAFEQKIRSDVGPFDAGGARANFSDWWQTAVGNLDTEANDTLVDLVEVRKSTPLDETFRRCVLETLRLPMLRAAYFGVYGSTPAVPAGGSATIEESLLGQARGVLDRLRDRLDEASQQGTAADGLAGDANADVTPGEYETAAEHELARLEALFGENFPVLPPLSLPNQAEVSQTFEPAHKRELLTAADPLETETWLQRTARVRERTAQYREALTYSEMVTERLLRNDLHPGQLPYEESDDWAGIDGVEPARGTVSLVTRFASEYTQSSREDGPDSPIARNPGTDDARGAQVAALLVDDWRMSVPATEETTGIAMNYDDPNTEPPQSILLAVPPDSDESNPWDEETLVRTIIEAMDLAKMRGVDLNAVGKPRNTEQRVLGHYLPALTLPLDTYDVPNIPSVDFEVDVDLAEDLLGGEDASGGEGS